MPTNAGAPAADRGADMDRDGDSKTRTDRTAPLDVRVPSVPAALRGIATTAVAECKERRARVLAHPDLAARLVAELGYAKPEQWNGYVPPRTDPEQGARAHLRGSEVEAPGLRPMNTSDRRRVLVAICAEALRRERET